MPLINRKATRGKLADLFQATGAFELVAKSERKKLEGRSPVLTLHGMGLRRARILSDIDEDYVRLMSTLYVVRSGESPPAEDAVEDQLDDLELVVAQVVYDNTALPGFWEWLGYEATGSQAGYRMIDGFQYRVEAIPLLVLVSEV